MSAMSESSSLVEPFQMSRSSYVIVLCRVTECCFNSLSFLTGFLNNSRHHHISHVKLTLGTDDLASDGRATKKAATPPSANVVCGCHVSMMWQVPARRFGFGAPASREEQTAWLGRPDAKVCRPDELSDGCDGVITWSMREY
eukprot:scaffold15140_cov63-Cyclotella_meneghiniana.AAC.5